MKVQEFEKKWLKKIFYMFLMIAVLGVEFACSNIEAFAVTFPTINVTFDANDQSVIVAGVPAFDSTGTIQYELNGYMNYGDERVETFCYAPSVFPYHVPEEQAYIFNWADAEFLLPCSGEYQFTAYLRAITRASDGTETKETGPKTTITINLTKKDESTNWGPGLPNTTVEVYDLKEIRGKDKTILIEEEGYTWSINGNDIENVPEENLSLAITPNPDNFPMQGVEEFFGDTLAAKFSIDYTGDFGFKATLDYLVGTEYIGKYANLFYVAGDNHFEYMEGGLVDENGRISYTFTHASDYIIAVTDVEYTGQELNPKPEEPVMESEPIDEPESSMESETVIEETTPETAMEDVDAEDSQVPADKEKTDRLSPFVWIGAMAGAIVIAVAIILIRNKNKEQG